MKKSILVILLVLLAFSFWSVLAIAKDKAAQKPTQVQQTEPNVAPDAFPKVNLPQAQPVRPTKEDFKREVLDRKSWTPETVNNQQVQPVPAADQEAAEKEAMPTLCTVGNALAGGYYHSGPGGNLYFYCWGDEVWATFTNPEDSVYALPRCAQPIYPFMAKQVMFAIYSLTDTAHVLFQPEIREALYDAEGCAYPGAAILTGPVYNIALGAGGVNSSYLSLVDSVCLYKPWFSVMHFLNSDDFFDTVYCAPINTSSWFSELFDNTGRTCVSYWNPYGPGGSWYDVTLYAISSGAVRVRTRGYSKTENTCPIPPDPWYFKDSLALAPCGVPDFDQAQFPAAYCGPVAEANSYWWLNAKWGFDLTPMDPVALVNEIAAAAGTVPGIGTNCDQLEAAILQVIKAHGAWWFTETTVYKPDFWWVQKELKKCEDVTLLLGFWQFQGGNWVRFGGHFVTLAGVDIYNFAFAFSDPALDKAEAIFPNPVFGKVCHSAPFPHVGNPLVHNDPANTSHDFYDVAWPSASPGGYLWLPGYVPGTEWKPDTTITCDTIKTCVPTLKNHFKTWRNLPEPFTATVFVQDQFIDDSLRLLGIEFLSNPVLKVHGADTFPILDSTHHLTWYRAEGKATQEKIVYKDQFVTDTVAIDSVRYLLIPTQKLPLDPPVGLDHYKAYRIKDPVAFHRSTLLEDQFDILSGAGPELIDSLKPVYFLTPAIKNSEPIYDPLTHYVAYEIFPMRPFSLLVNTVDQFGTHALPVLNSELLLVPIKCVEQIVCDTIIRWIPIPPQWDLFNGQNAGPFPNTGTYDPNPLDTVRVEIEQAIAVSPGPRRMSGEVDGSHSAEVNNNMGGITPFAVLFGANWVSPLYYGSFFSGITQADLRGDYGDYYPTMSFNPLGPPVLDNFTVAGSAGSYDIQMLTVNFDHPDIPGLAYEMHAFGVTVPPAGTQDCEYVIEDCYVISNETHADIADLEKAMFFDYDIGAANGCLVDWDQQHASMWMWDASGPDTVFGLTEIPAIKGVAPITGWGISNPGRVYDGQYVDSLKYWMENLGWGTDVIVGGGDMSLLLADPKFTVVGEGHHINKYLKWGYNAAIGTGGDAAWRHFLYNVLHQFGYYRGDADKNGKYDVADVIYMINYLFKSGPKPIEFVDQMDVDNNHNSNVADVIYSINYLFKAGPAPIDHERFWEAAPTMEPNHMPLTIRESLFKDAAWKTLGQ